MCFESSRCNVVPENGRGKKKHLWNAEPMSWTHLSKWELGAMTSRDDEQPAYLSEKGPSGASGEDQDGPLLPEPSAGRLWNSQYIPITIEQRLNRFLMSLHELGERFLHLCMQLSLIQSQIHCLMGANCANQASHIKSIFICAERAGGLNTAEDIRETQTLLRQNTRCTKWS